MSARKPAGFSLIELLVASAISIFMVMAIFNFASHETRLLGFTKQEIDIEQSARLALDLLADDLRSAGIGVGYAEDGTFAGLLTQAFTVPGNGSFSADNFSITLASGTVPTDDIGIRSARGGLVTVTDFGAGTGQVCAGSGATAGETVVLMEAGGMAARSVVIDDLAGVPCGVATCASGCQNFTWTDDNTYSSGSVASTVDYTTGELATRFAFIVWFVHVGADGHGTLRRAEVTDSNPCTARDETCGEVVAYDAESLQMRISRWDGSAWVDQTGTAITSTDRIRVDLELVMRSRSTSQRTQLPVTLELDSGTCLPNPCGTQDQISRRAVRTSVDIRNAGRAASLR